MQKCRFDWQQSILAGVTTAVFCGVAIAHLAASIVAQEIPFYNITPEELHPEKNSSQINPRDLLKLCQSTTVRVIKDKSAGTGAIVAREGNIYSVLTNWHVVDSSQPTILTADDQHHQVIQPPQQLGKADLAILRFTSELDYPVAQIETAIPQIGDTVYAAGFPLMLENGASTLHWGNKAFRLTQGQVSIIPKKPLPQGYRLGYTNSTENGMSGSPIFNDRGLLVGIHGRGKYRDPAFGVYLFADGSEPSPEQLQQMIESSWGIPISLYEELK